MGHFSLEQVRAAVQQHGTIFFDANLNPVVPEPGQWFCEYNAVIPEEGEDHLRDESLVEYLGPDESVVWLDSANAFVPFGSPLYRYRVVPEYADGDRRVQGEILVRQS